MPVLLPGIGQISVGLDNAGNTRRSYITFGLNVGLTPDWEDVATAMEAFMTDIIQDLSSQISSTEFLVTLSDGTDTGSQAFAYPGGTLTGGQGSDGVSPQVAYVYRKYTTGLGRKNRGRCYLPGCIESKVDSNGQVDATFLDGMRNHAVSALEQLATATSTEYQMLLLHGTGSDITPVTLFYPEAIVGTQRRRLVRS